MDLLAIKERYKHLSERELVTYAYAMARTAASNWAKMEAENPSLAAEERWRLTKMPLPKGIGNPIPHFKGIVDYTEDAIQAMDRYLPMARLDSISVAVTDQLETVMKSLYSSETSGAMFVAPAGWGKSTVFQYFGVMAAQHSLLHKELWMVNPNDSIKNVGNYREQHFITLEAGQLGTLRKNSGVGEMEGKIEDVKRTIDEYPPQTFTFVLDELADALLKTREDSDERKAFQTFKTTLADGDMRFLGVYATEDDKKMKESSGLFDGQWSRRMPAINMRDYNDLESLKVLRNSFNDFATKFGKLPHQVDDGQRRELYKTLIEFAKKVGPSEPNRKWGFPERLKKTVIGAASLVKNRKADFENLTAVVKTIEGIENNIEWYHRIVERSKSEIERVEGGSHEEELPNIPGEEDIQDDALSLRSENIPLEEGSNAPEGEGDDFKGERVQELQGNIQKAAKIINQQQRKLDALKLQEKHLRKKLDAKYGDLDLKEDLSDVANIKVADISRLDPSSVATLGDSASSSEPSGDVGSLDESSYEELGI